MFGCSHGSAPRGSPQSPYSSGPINNGYGMKLPVSSVQLVPLAPRTRIIILPMLCREHSPTLLQKWAQLPHVCVESVWGWGCTCHHLWGDSSHLSHSPAAEAEDFRDFNLRLQEGHRNISFYQSPIPRFHCVLNSLLLIQERNPAWSLSPCKVLPMWKKPRQAHRLWRVPKHGEIVLITMATVKDESRVPTSSSCPITPPGDFPGIFETMILYFAIQSTSCLVLRSK